MWRSRLSVCESSHHALNPQTHTGIETQAQMHRQRGEPACGVAITVVKQRPFNVSVSPRPEGVSVWMHSLAPIHIWVCLGKLGKTPMKWEMGEIVGLFKGPRCLLSSPPFNEQRKQEKPRLLETGGVLGGGACMRLRLAPVRLLALLLLWIPAPLPSFAQESKARTNVNHRFNHWLLFFSFVSNHRQIKHWWLLLASSPQSQCWSSSTKGRKLPSCGSRGGSIVNRRWRVPSLCSLDGALSWLSRHYECSSIQVEFPWALLITRPLCPPSAAENGSQPPRQHINICRNAEAEQRSREQRGGERSVTINIKLYWINEMFLAGVLLTVGLYF